MDEAKMTENHLNSAAAFVEGGILDSFDDACSICLEEFCNSDPSTLTTCKHEFHLHCILEWCQRSPQCPMCWQSISLKDPSSQELLDVVEHEKNIRMNPSRNTTIFHHPALGDFELQHLPAGATESELEERIIQHLTAAAAMGRARHLTRREGRNRSSAADQTRPRFLVFSTQPDGSSITVGDGHTQPASLMIGDTTTTPFITVGGDYTHLIGNANQDGSSSTNNRSVTQSSPRSQDQPGPSDLHSFTETVKSRFNLFSSRYKESITKSTRSWKERLFTRNTSTPNEVHGVFDRQGTTTTTIATVSPLMDHLGINEHGESIVPTVSHNLEDQITSESLTSEISGRHYLEESRSVSPCATSSMSN